jgi:hypothetical protein
MKQLVKNRDFVETPKFWWTDDLEWDPEKHAAFYVMNNKLGSAGGQVNAQELGLFRCVVETHKSYSKRSEFGTFTVHYGCVDISKIKQTKKRKNKQFDKDVHEMIIDYDPKVKHDPANADCLIIKTDTSTYRPLTPDEIFNYLEILFGEGKKKNTFPPHTRQLDIIKGRRTFLEQHRESDLILNIESIHTRFGKDKTNYLSIQPETEIIFDCSAYFATFQITSEFDPNRDQAVETRGRSKEEILDDIISARREGKRVWVLMSMFNDEDSERIELISLFKNTNAELIIDEVDYAAWSKTEIIKKVVEHVIN